MPIEFKVRGGRKEIISPPRVARGDLPSATEAAPKAQPNQPLVLALARAHRWQRMLDSGDVPVMEGIAARCSVNRTYVARMLQITSLAPDIVKAILAGNEPEDISLTGLREGVPGRWDEQRRFWSPG